MDSILSILPQTPLFAGIAPQDLPGLLRCLSAKVKFYAKQQTIFQAGDPAQWMGLICTGSVQVFNDDFTGNRSIVAQLGPGELFGEAFVCAEAQTLPVNTVAVERSDILLLDYHKITSLCPSPCVFHSVLVENMMRILAAKNVLLNQKIQILSRRSTREKLIAFLSVQAQAAGSHSFSIPFNRQELADYLCVERSAMSAQLSKLKRDGLVDFDKNTFVLRKDS